MAASPYKVSRLRRKLRRFPEETTAGLKQAIKESAADLEAEIRTRAPKDTGRLAENAFGQVSRDGLSALAGYSKNRPGFKRKWRRGGFEALWQEFGAKQHAPQPFIAPAFRARLRGILDRIDAAVSETIRKAQNWKG
jgi:hypothetical protein